MKIKIQKAKFIRNIIIGIIALFIVAFIVNTAPGYKRNKYRNVINLVIGDENVTEKLKKPIYKDGEGIVYISKEDLKEFLDKTLYYDEENSTIIATSDVSVASMKVGEKSININGVATPTLDTAFFENDILYIPIDEIKIVYNISANYLEEENVVIIDKLNEGMIKAEAKEKTKIRFKQRTLSKQVGQLEVGDTVSAFYTTSKGWRLIRTQNGIIGYVKANTLTNEYIVRQDMEHETETQKITMEEIKNNGILINDLFKVTEEGILLKNTEGVENAEDTNIWANVTMENIDLKDFNTRSKLIKNLVTISMKKNIKGINIIVTNNDIYEERFVIELAPRLREIGIMTNIITDDSINEDKYTGIVRYIISK